MPSFLQVPRKVPSCSEGRIESKSLTMNNNRQSDQCPRELLSRWVELTAMLYFEQGNREQVQVELTKLMSEAEDIGLFKRRFMTVATEASELEE